ncbi:sigma-70 family RNA polymerase sigma factor [Mucilaginibacter sp. HMF5004]|uniref:RNA polymerase sigma factor n=1 Tax=Mucilaginibacter rivuli TaxID=2857527 RepID=UPI001C5F87CF|nr:sigma-70 family RNA polymerase sigma factor [Mucilaginibacter rivuli]MBW4889751.1 sigma-70 family RNA polymerase sigma factor [Mucilaginibacter rivuli]
MNKSDQLSQWWRDALQGNVDSFSHIHHELYPVLYHYLLKIFKDEDISQDILQDLFIKLWERRQTIGLILNVKVYFFKTARSLAFNYLKCRKNHSVALTDDMDFDIEFSQEEILMNKENSMELNRLLLTALNTLPKRQKEMIFLRYFDGWNYDEIAEVTGIKYQSVVNNVHRGILQLRTELISDKYFQNCRMAI